MINVRLKLKMSRWIRAISFSTMAFLTLALPARGSILFNGSFENVGAASSSYSINSSTVLPGWAASGSGNNLDCLVFAGATTNLCGSAFGGGFSFWVNPGSSPDGGNYVTVDGDQSFSSPLTQTLSGLVVGEQYNVSFWQAAAQQQGPNFNGATTEQWQVKLGTDSQFSTLMNNASHGYVGWMSQTLTFTASAASEVLGFIAVGTPNGIPPFVLLDGVSFTAIPEPATYALMGIGLLSIPIARKLLKKRS